MKNFKFFLASIMAMALSACVVSRAPLLVHTEPTSGQQFELHLYEGFKDGKAHDFHTASYQWKNGKYVRTSGLAQEAKSIAVEPLGQNDFIIEGTGENESIFTYWIARRISAGVYLIFPIVESDIDIATRTAICKTDKAGACMIETHDQLVTLARATAAKPVRDPALGVILEK